MPGIELSISGSLPVSDEVVAHNMKNANGLGLPNYRRFQPTAKHLAVIGGGPSIREREKQIKEWDGDIWAINGAFQWVRDLGRDAVFLAVDPHPIVLNWLTGVQKALLETRVDPEVFARLSDKEVYVFDIGSEPGQLRSGSSAATTTPHLACRIGYHSVTLFGCESSYQPQNTHAYQHEKRDEEMIVLCGKGEYLTAPDFYMQAIELAKYINEVPEYIKEESGGLLRAMLNNNLEHSIHWVSEGMAKTMRKMNQRETISV